MVSESAMPCQNFTTINLAAGTTWYTLPSDYRYAKKVRFFRTNQQPVELYEQTTVQTITQNPNYDTSGGTPYAYWVNYAPTSSVNNGATVASPWSVAIISPPNSTSTGTVVFQYFAQCSDLVNVGDTPYNGLQAYQSAADLPAYWAAYKISVIEGDNDQAKEMMALFSAGVAAFKTEIGSLPNWNPGMNSGNPTGNHY